MRHVCVINGPGAHGKDTFVAHALIRAGQLELPGYNFSSIDPCRRRVYDKYGILPTDKSEVARRALVEEKQCWLAEDPDGPNKYLLDSARSIQEGLVFFHIREPEQIAGLLDMAQLAEYGRIAIETMHVIRPGHPIPNNPIDQGTLGPENNPFPYDVFYENDGSEEDLQADAYRWTEGRVLVPRGVETMGPGLPSRARR